MVVDDSVVIRGLISRWIEAEPDMMVAASLRTGQDAVNQVERANPDVVILDIEMPDLDGISALPQLLAKKRNLIIIMASTLTRRNAEISFRALSLGAADYIPKPESTREIAAADIFKHDLMQKIRHLAAKRRRPAVIASPPLAPHEKERRPAAARAGASGTGAASLQPARPARAVDRFVHRRTAGVDDASGGNRTGDRPLPGADHATHAADIHNHSRRASGAGSRTSGA